VTAYAASALFKLDGTVSAPYYSAFDWEKPFRKARAGGGGAVPSLAEGIRHSAFDIRNNDGCRQPTSPAVPKAEGRKPA